jgi:hypothetical protein
MKNAAGFIDHCFETFHEIIYGKSERGANERRVFCLWIPLKLENGSVLEHR